jgi:DNA binding protein with HTH domain
MSKQLPRRANLQTIATIMGISLRTLREHLKKAGAPRPNQAGTWPVHEVIRFASLAAAGGVATGEAATIKTKRAKIALEREEYRFAHERGEYVEKKIIGPTLDRLFAEIVKGMRDSFEFELPSKYKGKSVVECQQMNIAAIDGIISRFKQGSSPLKE